MTKIARITAEQAKSLQGVPFTPDNYFAPFEVGDGIWAISEQEVNGCTNEDVAWVNDLKLDKDDYTNGE